MRLATLTLLAAATSGAATVNLTYSGTMTGVFPSLTSALAPGDTWTLSLDLDLSAIRSPFQPMGPTQLEFPGAVANFALSTSGAWGGVSMGTASNLSPILRLQEDATNGDVLHLGIYQASFYPSSDPGYDADPAAGEPFALFTFQGRHDSGFFSIAGHPPGASLGHFLNFGSSALMPSGGSLSLGFGFAGQFTGGGTTSAFATTAVPEPSTYGLILGGVALAGAALRRRRKS